MAIAPKIFALPALLLIAATGCTTAVYHEEIASFKSSTDSAVDVVKTYISEKKKTKSLNKFRRELNEIEGGDGQVAGIQLRLSEGCDQIVSDPQVESSSGKSATTKCFVKLCQTGESSRPCDRLRNGLLYQEPELLDEKNAIELLDALATYADSLQRISSSDTSKQVDTTLEELSSSITQFAKARGDDEAKQLKIETRVGALSGLFSWMVGKHLDQSRWAALREVTYLVNPELTKTKTILQDIAVNRRNEYGLALLDQETLLNNVIDVQDNKDAIEQARTVHSRMRKVEILLNSQPSLVFEELVNAHAELTKAIDNPRAQRASVLASLRDFRKSIDKVREAF